MVASGLGLPRVLGSECMRASWGSMDLPARSRHMPALVQILGEVAAKLLSIGSPCWVKQEGLRRRVQEIEEWVSIQRAILCPLSGEAPLAPRQCLYKANGDYVRMHEVLPALLPARCKRPGSPPSTRQRLPRRPAGRPSRSPAAPAGPPGRRPSRAVPLSTWPAPPPRPGCAATAATSGLFRRRDGGKYAPASCAVDMLRSQNDDRQKFAGACACSSPC